MWKGVVVSRPTGVRDFFACRDMQEGEALQVYPIAFVPWGGRYLCRAFHAGGCWQLSVCGSRIQPCWRREVGRGQAGTALRFRRSLYAA